MEVSGYLRGLPLSVNGLVHIPGFGDFQMKRIDALRDPFPVGESLKSNSEMDDDIRVLETADPTKQVINQFVAQSFKKLKFSFCFLRNP